MKCVITLGVYSNGQYKYNIVDPNDLEDHIFYNKTLRFGRILYVDGERVYNGCIREEYLDKYDKIAEDFFTNIAPKLDLSKPSYPYQ